MDKHRPFGTRSSIRFGLLRLLALLLAIALISSSVLIWSAYAFARNQSKRQMLDTTRALSRVVDGEFARYEAMLHALAASPSVTQHDWGAVDRAGRATLSDPDAWIVAIDRSGQQLVNTRLPIGAKLPGHIFPRDTWPVLDSGRTHICDLERSVFGEPILCVDVPIYGNGRVVGLLSVVLRPRILGRVLAQRLPTGWHATVLDSRNVLVWRNGSNGKYLGHKATPHIVEALRKSDENVIHGRGLEGLPVYVAYSRSPTSRWTFVISAPRNQLDSGIWSALIGGLVVVVLMLAIGGVAAVHWTRRVTRGVEALAEGAAALASRGTFRRPYARIRELDDIAVAMDDADRSLRQRDQDLASLHASLAERIDTAIAQREIALEQLNEARKLETLGQLTGGVAHDFNNLLSPIMSSLEILQYRYGQDPRNVRLIEAALTSSERAKTLVARLLSFSRRQALRPSAVDVSTLVEGMADLIRRSFGSSISVTIDADPEVAFAYVDSNQLELAILNLAVNARDAMPQGGDLIVAVQERDVPAEGAVDLKPGRYVRISVADTGIGMDEATVRHAIEPFFTTKEPGRGTGLGLSMVHGLAAQSGGGFVLASEAGRGTQAEIWLPCGDVALPGSVKANAPAQAEDGLILLVDDDHLVRTGTAEMLMALGYTVRETGSGAEALRIVTEGADILCLVTDFKMPEMNGEAVIAAARALRPALPIVLISGYMEQDAVLPKNISRLEKPFRQKNLATAVNAAIAAQKDR